MLLALLQQALVASIYKAISEKITTKTTPAWLVLDAEKMAGKVDRFPSREEIDAPIAEHLIVELYSK